MFIGQLIAAVVVALIFSFILVGILGWQRPGREGAAPALLFVFLFLLAIVWAGGIWLQPVGPYFWGVGWIPFLLIGLFAALVILALVPPHRPRNRREALQQAETRAEAQTGAEAALSVFFWLLVMLLIAAIIIRYV